MPIHTVENQYRGVNAHLHSYFQQVDGWVDFHMSHITDLRRAIQTILPLSSGYRVAIERSLQIAQYDVAMGVEKNIQTRVDVGFYKPTTYDTTKTLSVSASTPTMVFPTSETLIEPEEAGAVLFYKMGEQNERLITRLEVLSPANKPPGSHSSDYLIKRNATLRSGVKVVEIDYLHERRSPVARIPAYTTRVANAYPYTITVSEYLADDEHDMTQVYAFRVDDPIPVIAVPLDNDDHVVIDFAKIYATTFSGNNLHSELWVDYEQLPLNFEAYDEEDQRRIRVVMERAKHAHPHS